MKWEYMYITYYTTDYNNIVQKGEKHYEIYGTHAFLIEKLDKLGAMGWEAFSETSANTTVLHLLLKRLL